MTIGIYGISSQSGRAFLADYLNKGYHIIGYTRPTEHGNEVLDAIHKLGGLYMERPENSNHETSRFINLGKSSVTADLEYMVSNSTIIIIPLPSTAHISAVREMNKVGLWKRRIPLVLAPSRSVASPYIWNELGERYPIICFSTCPYSCKAPKPVVSLIKRRKRTYIATLEGDINRKHVEMVRELFPQAALSTIPALSSLNNIGAVFHCATYILNIDEIERRKKSGEVFSFYMDGIASRPGVGVVLEQIDQIRLQIANALGIRTFGLKNNPREDIWRKLTNGLRALEEESADDIEILRRIRKEFTEYLDNCVISAQHWLDITYGVERKDGESLSKAIGRTPTYQKNSVPQFRYVTEDIPTGLVVFESLAKMLDIDCSIISNIINLYNTKFNVDARAEGRNLKDFDREYMIKYLKGD
jgi:NAD/NADP octopine/nopaline dehydrogenase